MGERQKEWGEHRLFAFLTCDANDLVHPIPAKAMPVILMTPESCDAWLTGQEAVAMQNPLPSEQLRIVATGQLTDEGAPA